MTTLRHGPVTILVLDGLGIGAMPGASGRDTSAHTLRHVLDASRDRRLPHLQQLGLLEVAGMAKAGDVPIQGARGRAALDYPGADTFLGHQALMGVPTLSVQLHMLEDVLTALSDALREAGHRVGPAADGVSALLVDDVAVVADNVEAAAGLNINVTASLDEIAFDALLGIGEIVRRVAAVPRVIVVGGRGYRAADILRSFRAEGPGHVGVDTPRLGVYDEHYQVRHLAAPLDASRSLPAAVLDAGRQVMLLGKAADVIDANTVLRSNLIPTAKVLAAAEEALAAGFDGLLIANVQETDLAGHEQDRARFLRIMSDVDDAVPGLLRGGRTGYLIVTADHGNDPGIGHSQHTREYVPVLIAGPGIRPVQLGTLGGLSDVAATVAELMGLPRPSVGTSFAAKLGLAQGPQVSMMS
jgi:phosphopentomutase